MCPMRARFTSVAGALLVLFASPLFGAVETGRTQTVPEAVSGWPVWNEIALERGDTGPWNECARVARTFPTLVGAAAFSIDGCVRASAELSGVRVDQFDALPVGTRIWVPSVVVELSEVWRRVTSAELRGEPFLLIEDVPAAREALGITELTECIDTLGESVRVVTDGLDAIENGLDTVGNTLQNHASAIETLDDRLGDTAHDVSVLGDQVSGLEATIDRIDGTLASVQAQVQRTGLARWFSNWWWVPLIIVLFILTLIALAALAWYGRRTERNLATERGRVDNVKGTSEKAIAMAKLSSHMHFSAYELKGDPPTQEMLERSLTKHGDVYTCELIERERPEQRRLVTFTRLDDAFGDGRPGLRVDGISGQRRPIAFRASAIMERLALATRTDSLTTSAA